MLFKFERMFLRCFQLTICVLCAVVLRGQPAGTYRWYDPASLNFAAVGGQYWWGQTASFYDRLPARAKSEVRREVWNLGENSAGEYISFTTNASEIIVRLKVSERRAMLHMPATGVSGVDLYAKNGQGKWLWASAEFKFGDTIEYRFANLQSLDAKAEYRLYLPLYNTVKWLSIGIKPNESLHILPRIKQKPVVVYGTSIAQGGCASRPGLGWTNILNRLIDTEIINLAFSGNGRLEPPVIDLINEIDASIYVLDCLPNLVDRKTYPAEELQNRLIESVKTLRAKHPLTPILLAEHAVSNPQTNLDTSVTSRYAGTNVIFLHTLELLKKQGFQHLYLITASEIKLTQESTVDGTHPNDIGMMEYAEAYAKKIRQILK